MNYRNNYGAGGKMPAWLLKKLKKRAMANGGKLRYYALGGEVDKVPAGSPTEDPTPSADFLAEAYPPMTRREAILEGLTGRYGTGGRKVPLKQDNRLGGFGTPNDEDPTDGRLMGYTMPSETTQRVGGFEPTIATAYRQEGKPAMTKTIEEKPKEEERIIIPPEFPTEEPKDIPAEVDFNMDTEGLSSMPIFKRGIESTGMRGQGTTGDFRGVRSDITKDGRLMEKGEVTSVEDMPEYIREDPTFKNLLAQANETKYMQDIGRKEGKYSTPGGQAAKDLADIMSGRITLDAYKERQNRASASFGYGGKMKFGVVKKRRGGR